MKNIVLTSLFFLTSTSALANGFNWYRHLYNTVSNSAVETVTMGGDGYEVITEFLDDSETGNLICGVDDSTGFEICQLRFEGGYRTGFSLSYYFDDEVFRTINSSTYGFSASQDDEFLTIHTPGAGGGHIPGTLIIDRLGMVVSSPY